MNGYESLQWSSLTFALTHLIAPAAEALHACESAAATPAILRERSRLDAWSALIRVKSGAALPAEDRGPVRLGELPAWLTAVLPLPVTLEGERAPGPVSVHAAAFYESLILLGTLAQHIGGDARLAAQTANGRDQLWVRATFTPPAEGAYKGVSDLVRRLEADRPAHAETLDHLHLLRDFLALDAIVLKVQTNTETGAQALAICLPMTQAAAAPETSRGEVDPTPDSAPDSVPEPAPDADEHAAPDETSNDVPVPAEDKPRLAGPAIAHPPEPPAKRPTPPAAPDTITCLPPADDQPGENPAESSAAENGVETLIVPPARLRAQLTAETAVSAASERVTLGGDDDTAILPPVERESEQSAKKEERAAESTAQHKE